MSTQSQGHSSAANQRLEQEVRRNELLLNSVADGVFGVDVDGRITFVNPTAEAMFGWTRDELIGTLLHDKLHCRRPDGTWYSSEECPHTKVLITGATVRSEDDFFVHQNGTILPVSCSIAPIQSAGLIAGGVMVVRDITEQKLAEAAARLALGTFPPDS